MEPLFYRHAHALLAHAPVPALASFLRLHPGLNPAMLLPAIVHLVASCDATLALPAATPAAKAEARAARAAAVRYLEHCVEESGAGGEAATHCGRGALGVLPPGASGSSSGGGGAVAPASLYNYLLQLYAQRDQQAGAGPAGAGAEEEEEERLLGFLQAHAGHAGGLLDLAYALRVCARHGRTRACVHLYSCMGMYEVRSACVECRGVCLIG